MRLVFAEPAERDLGNIIDYIALDNPAAAEKVFRAIITTAGRLTRFPEIGRIGRVSGTYELIVTGLPYLIVYQVTADTITVVAVFHGARDLTQALAERQGELSRQ
ncbi:MAG: type II toxin-antitoxin system RelE/ParE family toxin [Rhodospirillaceae bacterium]|nr:type II toxin-antitoxin system RelE/ParE family toxin [Rhodospirillaceae bacterium]